MMSDEKREQAMAREELEDLHRQIRKLIWGEKGEPEPWFPSTRTVLEGAIETITALRVRVVELEEMTAWLRESNLLKFMR